MAGTEVTNRIVVGMDGSDYSTIGLRWATEEAAIHGATVEVLLAWNYLDQHRADRSDTFDPGYTEEVARDALAAWVTGTLGPNAEVERRVVLDTPARALLEAGDEADLLVLGARGIGGFEGLLLGSVSERVAQNATRPVAVVRAATPVRTGRVVVGVDGSARSLAALRWAAAEAIARDADLDVVHAWRWPMMAMVAPSRSMVIDLSTAEEAGRSVLDRALEDPAVMNARIRRRLSSKSAAHALVDLAAGAGLVVVGSRGLGRVTGALLGSVSRQLLPHAPCPVVVI